MKKKKWIFAIIFSTFVCSLYFSSPFLAKTALKHFLSKCDDISFECNAFGWNQGHLSIREGKVFKKGEFSLSFETLVLNPFKMLQKKLSLTISAPTLKLMEGATNQFPDYLKEWTVAQISLTNGRLEGPGEQALKMEIVGKEGNFSFSFVEEEKGGKLNLIANFQPQKMSFEGTASHLNLSPLSPFINLAIPKECPFQIKEGRVTGEVYGEVVKHSPLFLKSNFSAQELQLIEPRSLICVNFHHLNGDILTCNGKKEGMIQLDGGETTLPLLKEKITCPKILCHFHENLFEMIPAQFTWKNVKGLMQVDGTSKFSLSCSGNFLEISPLFPHEMDLALRKKFNNDFFSLKVNGSELFKDIGLCGELCIGNQNVDSILFGYNTQEIAEEFTPLRNLSCYLDKGFREKFQSPFKKQPKGWVKANSLSLTKFLSPFVLHSSSVEIEGRATLVGFFDLHHLVVGYSLENCTIGSSSFAIDVGHEGMEIAPGVKGVHTFNLRQFSHKGLINVSEVSFLHKNCDLLFEKGEGLVFFEDRKIFFKSAATCWKDISFAGDLEFIIGQDLELKILTNSVEGTLERSREFLAKFIHFPIWNTPLNGSLSSEEGGIELVFKFTPKVQVVSGDIRGAAIGTWNHPLFESAQGGFGFHYSFADEKLSFTDLKGNCTFLGESKQRYQFRFPDLFFKDFSDLQFGFSMEVAGESKRPFSILGSCVKDKENRKCLSVEGPSFCFAGSQKGKDIAINAYRLAEVVGQARLSLEKNKLRLHEITALYDEGIEGWATIEFDFAQLTATVVQSSVGGQLSKILQLNIPSKLKEWINDSHLTGHFDGRISSRYHFMTGEWEMEGEGLLQALECGQIPIAIERPFKVEGSSSHGWSLKNIYGHLEDLKDCSSFSIDEIRFDKKLEIDKLCFSLSPHHKKQIKGCLYHLSAKNIDPSIANYIYSIRKEGRVSGEISLKQGYVDYKLGEGHYALNSDDFSIYLKEAKGRWDLSERSLSIASQWNEVPFQAYLKFNSELFNEGSIRFVSSMDPSENGITLFWNSFDRQLSIPKIEGTFSGLQVQLKEVKNSDDSLVVEGFLGIDGRRICRLLPQRGKEILEKCDLGNGYCFEGRLTIPKDNWSGFEVCGTSYGRDIEIGGMVFDSLSSEFAFSSGNFSIKSFRITDSAGHLWIPLVDLRKTQQEQWKIMIPKIAFSNLRVSRHQGKGRGETRRRSYLKTLYIPFFEIDAFSGCLGEPHSFSAKAELQFANLTPKNFISKILSIPSEITARIGLDPTLLIPVQGTIHSEISGGKIHLTRFEEVFSQGKRSRFYIPKRSSAFIDFDGNINLNIKMKQYNLLMKIAEFFTIGIRGTLLKPSYSLGSHDEDEFVADLCS